MEHRCPKCGEVCLQSPQREHSAQAGEYRFTVRGIPFFSCPRGCVVDQPDVGQALVPLLRLVGELSRAVAKTKGFFRKRRACRACGEELVQEPSEGTWDFRPDPAGPIELVITGPGFPCPRCGKTYLPRPVDLQSLGQTMSGPT